MVFYIIFKLLLAVIISKIKCFSGCIQWNVILHSNNCAGFIGEWVTFFHMIIEVFIFWLYPFLGPWGPLNSSSRKVKEMWRRYNCFFKPQSRVIYITSNHIPMECVLDARRMGNIFCGRAVTSQQQLPLCMERGSMKFGG